MDNTGDQITSYLIEKGLVRKEDLEKIVPPNQPSEGLRVEEYLINSGLLTEEEFHLAVEEFFGVPFAAKDDFPKEALLINNLSAQFMKESKFLPASLNNNELTVIMGNPLDFYTMDALRLATDFEIRILAGRESEILEVIERLYGSSGTSMEKIIEDLAGLNSAGYIFYSTDLLHWTNIPGAFKQLGK
jgi:hypothetical protein